MQNKSNKLLEAEVRDLEDALTKTLYSFVDKAIDARHAVTILIEKGAISEKVIRNVSIIQDFDDLNSKQINSIMGIYYSLSVKYDISVNLIRKIIRERNK